MSDPKKLFESRDMEGAILYAKRVSADNEAWPLLADEDGNLRVNMTVGTVSLSSTASTITNAVGNPVNVSVTNTVVTIGGGSVSSTVSSTSITASTTVTGTVTTNVVGGNINISSATLGTVTISGNVNISSATLGTVVTSFSSTLVTVENTNISKIASSIHDEGIATTTRGMLVLGRYDSTVPSAVDDGDAVPILTDASGRPRVLIQDIQTPNGDSAMDDTNDSVKTTPTITASTINNAVGNPVNVSLTSTVVTVSNTAGTVTNSVSSLILISKTLTGSTGSVTTTNTSISVTPSGRVKVYAFSLTTTFTTSLICIFHSGSVANGLELWRVLLQAPSGANAGANLAVSPPGFLFQSRAGTSVSLSLSTAAAVHYSLSYYDEA